MNTSYIGADVDSKMTDIAVERGKRIVQRFRVPTTIPALRAVLEQIPGRKKMAIEEGPLAHWLWRHLRDCVDELVICDPRRNAYIAKDGDKDDAIDAAKLAELLRGGYLRPVHHSDDEGHVLFKRWVGLYHDRVQEGVRQVNKLRGCCRHYGVRWTHRLLAGAADRRVRQAEGIEPELMAQLQMLAPGLEAVGQQVKLCRSNVRRMAKSYPVILRWQAVPGVGLIRSATLYAYLDTPWRFARRTKLWKYCGVGIEQRSSGKDKCGRPKVGPRQLAWQVNKRLKDAVMGATISAIRQGANPFAEGYERRVRDGMTPANARHTTARTLVLVLWSMWKTGQLYDPSLVGVNPQTN